MAANTEESNERIASAMLGESLDGSGSCGSASRKRLGRLEAMIIPWRYLGLAFFWAASMLTFRSSILLVGDADTVGYNTFVVVVSFVANMTFLFAMAALVERSPRYLAKIPSALFCVAIIGGFVFIRCAGELPCAEAVPVMLCAGAVLCGVGYGYFWGSWADALGRIHPSVTAVSMPVVFLLTAALFVGITLVVSYTPIPAIALMIPLPLLSWACLERSRKDPAAIAPKEASSQRYIEAVVSLVPLLIATIVLSLLFGFLWETTVLSMRTATEAHGLPLVANLIAAIVLLGGVIVARRKVDLTLTYRILIPIAIVLFVVIPFFWSDQPVLMNAVMSALYGVFDVIIWYLVVSTSYDLGVSGFVVGGIVRGVSILSRLIGIGIGFLVMLEPLAASGAMMGVCIGAVYVLGMLLWFLRRSTARKAQDDQVRSAAQLTVQPTVRAAVRAAEATGETEQVAEAAAKVMRVAEATDEAQQAAEAPMKAKQVAEATEEAAPVVVVEVAAAEKGAGADRAASEVLAPEGKQALAEEDRYGLMAREYGLTRREAEVLSYLARGRSAKVIAEALFVSESTIRTHTRRILEKTCLHSKQELIDLVERY